MEFTKYTPAYLLAGGLGIVVWKFAEMPTEMRQDALVGFGVMLILALAAFSLVNSEVNKWR